jgi:hypothetical protein
MMGPILKFTENCYDPVQVYLPSPLVALLAVPQLQVLVWMDPIRAICKFDIQQKLKIHCMT